MGGRSGWIRFGSIPPRAFVLALALAFVSAASPGWSEVNRDPFPKPLSKKGLQVQMVDDALALGIKHAALNVNLAQMPDLERNPESLVARFSHGDYAFHKAYIEHLDGQIKALSDAGVVVSLILLYYRSANEALNRIMLHPRYDPAAPNHLSAFNLSTPESGRYFRACVEFLAQRYSGARDKNARGRVWNYIVGNEVNSHWFWANMGAVSMEEFADDYLRAVRACHESVRNYSAEARVYLSLEHHWGIRYPGGSEKQAFPGRPFLDYFAAQARAGGDFDWHVAFHPYPEDLFDCRTWRDRSARASFETERITFRNIEMLPRYLAAPEMRFQGQTRRIILSEQGFHSPDQPRPGPEGVDGETLQAAAYCYAWMKIASLEGIDSFILHRHVDHGQEGGLNLGLWSRDPASTHPAEPRAKKKIYEIFKGADTGAREELFRFALPVIGIRHWQEIKLKPE